MKSSAKVTVSIIAAMALGAVGFACTIGSGTVNDVDGGTSTSSSSSSSSSGATPDAGDAGNTTNACPAFTGPDTFDPPGSPATCDSCQKAKCCSELAGCWNTPDEPVDGGKEGCRSHSACLISCDDNFPGDKPKSDECKEFCEAAAIPGVPDAFGTFQTCREAKCATECP